MTTTELGLRELVLQTLEGELAGRSLYKAALTVAVRKDLAKEWRSYLEETERHLAAVRELCDALEIPQDAEDAGRTHVRNTGRVALETVEGAAANESPERAQILATQCILEAEMMDQLRWHTLALFAENATGSTATAVRKAAETVGDDEAEHFLHSRGWLRELLLERMGRPAALPPPEEEKSVKTLIGAGRAEGQRDEYAA